MMLKDIPFTQYPYLPHIVRDTLAGAKDEFVLTGSRFAGTYKPHSDWDFFVRRWPGLKEFLMEVGFKSMSTFDDPEGTDYNGVDDPANYTVDVLQHKSEPVQIQVVTDIKHAVATRDLVYTVLKDKDMQLHMSDETTRRKLWCQAAAVIATAMGIHHYDKGGW